MTRAGQRRPGGPGQLGLAGPELDAAVISRRQCLSTLGLAAAALAAAPLLRCSPDRRGPPNLLLILSDDQGSTDLGCYGAADLHTPALDGLAARGVRFSQFYAAAPASMAARASLLTGRQYVRAIGGDGLLAEEVTLAEMLRQAGYRTACFGKWHLGLTPAQDPRAQGFDEFLGFRQGAMDNYSHYNYWGGFHRHVLERDGEPHHEDGAFFPDIVTREALRFIDANRDRPFFLYLPFNMPHYPLQPEPRFLALYDKVNEESRRLYGAFLSSMDDRVGQVLKRLDQRGLRRDTIVLFLSDHGHSVDERGFGGGGQAAGLRGYKGTLFEGGIRVPCILSAPGRVPEGEVRDQPVTSLDLLPTIAEYTGAPLPDCQLDGVSLSGVLAAAGAAAPRADLHWVYQTWWVAREGNWKAVGDVSANNLSLFDLATDPGESRSVAGDHRDMVSHLIDSHNDWVRSNIGNDPNVLRMHADPNGPAGDDD